MKILVVEANISAGKSTMLPALALHLGYTHIQEPVDDPTFTRLLKLFTQNPTDTKIRLDFQRYITSSRSALLKGLPDGNYVVERSLFSDLIFSQVNMLGMERPSGEYLSYYYDIIDQLKDYPQTDAIIYLRTNPEAVHNRLLERGRDAEQGTPLEYMRDLHNYHEACLPQICRAYNTELITFEWDKFGAEIGGIYGVVAELRSRGVV
jgi:deoxyadenosine/deoxycytidine kinase